MKTIEYTKQGLKWIHINNRGNKMIIYSDNFYIWIAPIKKMWSSRKFRREDVKLVEVENIENQSNYNKLKK